jgi:hypothetical protein
MDMCDAGPFAMIIGVVAIRDRFARSEKYSS